MDNPIRFFGNALARVGITGHRKPRGLNALKGRTPRIEQLEQRQLLSIGSVISGTVFEDVDRDGAYDIDERGLAGWTVELQRIGDDGGDRVHTFANPDQDGSRGFGSSVAVLGQNIVVGVAEDAGLVHIFDSVTGKLQGTFDNPVSAENPTLAAGDLFGHAVVAMGENILVSAPQADTAGRDAGAVYLLDGDGAVLQTFINPTPEARDGFGWSMAAMDDHVLIGAPFDNTGGENAGAVYVFSAKTGKLEATIPNPTPEAWEWFGYSLATVDGAVVVGAPYDNAGADSAGAAYLFECDAATGEWTASATYLSPTASPHDMFGHSVAAVGRRVSIGSPGDDTATLNAGAAYLFDAQGGSPIETFLSPAPGAANGFGWCVVGAHDGNLLISAPWNDTAGRDAGAVFRFDGGGADGFDGSADGPLKMFANPSGMPDAFGTSVAVIGDRIIVGAKDADAATHDSGAVYMFGTDTVRMTTDPLGLYAFTDLPAGTYEVREIMPDGRRYEQTYPGGDGAHTVELGNNQIAQVLNFGNYKIASLDDAVEDTDVLPSGWQPLPYHSLGWPQGPDADGAATWDDANEPPADTFYPDILGADTFGAGLLDSGRDGTSGYNGQAPMVIGVSVDNTDSAHDPYDFTENDEGDEQLHSVPIGGGINEVTITFDRNVDDLWESYEFWMRDALSITDQRTGDTYNPSDVEYVGDMTTWKWTFAAPVSDGEMILVLSDSVRAGGTALDGEWENPRYFGDTFGNSNFDVGSGNGIVGGDFVFHFTLLPGDANQDGFVDDIDATIMAVNWGRTPATWRNGDFNGDDVVNEEDAAILSMHWLTAYWQDGTDKLEALLDAYESVVNTIEFQPYVGSMKSPEAVLQTGEGNSWDTAALLAELLAEEGIATQYVAGRISVPVDEAMAYVGVTDPQAAEDVLDRAGLVADLVADDMVFNHAWLEAQWPIGGNDWVALDASWKFQDHGPEVRNMLGEVSFKETGEEGEEFYLSQPTTVLADEYYEAQVRDYLAENDPSVSIADIPYAGPILVQQIDALPDVLPYDIWEPGSETTYETIPANLTHRVRVSLGDGQDQSLYFQSDTLSLPTMGQMPLTLRPTPSGNDVIPELLLSGQSIETSSTSLSPGDVVVLTIEHFDADGNSAVDRDFGYFRDAGQYLAIAIDANQISGELVLGQQRFLSEATVDYLNKPTTYDMDTHIGGLLHLAGLKYFHDTDASEDVICGLTAGVPVQGRVASAVLTASTEIQNPAVVNEGLSPGDEGYVYYENLPFQVLPETLNIDVKNGSWGAVSINGDPTYNAERFKMLGHTNCALEHAVWEELTTIESISAIKSLQLANEAASATPPTNEVLTIDSASLVENGIAKHYADGTLSFTYQGNGDYRVSGDSEDGTKFQRYNKCAVGDIQYGIATSSGADGSGFIMYSEVGVHTRFTNPPANNSDHFIAVVYLENHESWFYDDGVGFYRSFDTEDTDLLVAEINFADDTITTVYQGVTGTASGNMAVGYIDGDLTFHAQRWNGQDEVLDKFTIEGTWFVRYDTIEVAPLDNDVVAQDGAEDVGYIMYSKVSVHTRFSGGNAPDPSNSDHFIAVKYFNDQWHYDNGSGYYTFDTADTDRLIATVDFDTNTATNLDLLDQSKSIENSVWPEAMGSGSTITIPKHPTPLNEWNGVGWIVNNPQYVGYMISGGLSGETSAAMHGGSTTGEPGADATTTTPIYTTECPTQTYTWGIFNIFDGNVGTYVVDISLPGPGPAPYMARCYNSRHTGSDTARDGLDSDRGMGSGWSFTYSDRLEHDTETGSLTWFTDTGERLTFEYDAGNDIYITPESIHGTLVFDDVAMEYVWEDKTGNKVIFDEIDPDNNGRLLEVKDRYGNGVEVSYDDTNPNQIDHVEEFVVEGGDTPRRLDFTYDTNGHITGIDDFTGREWTYDYDDGRLDQVIPPSGEQMQYAYYTDYTDAAREGLLSQATDPLGNTTNFTYYANRRGFEVVDAEGSARAVSYNLFRDSTAAICPRGNVTDYTYNDKGNVTETRYADRTTVAAVWEESRRTSGTDAFGQTETYEYDNAGNMTYFEGRQGDSFTTYKYSDDLANLTLKTEIVRPDGVEAFDLNEYTIYNYSALSEKTVIIGIH